MSNEDTKKKDMENLIVECNEQNKATAECIASKYFKKQIITVQLKDIVSADFNREIKKNRVEKIVKNFNVHRMDMPCVGNPNEEGKYPVWDGQHRVAALRVLLGNDGMVDVVLDDVGYMEMAKLFIDQDVNRENVSTVDKFKARVKFNDPIACDIANILDKYGLSIGSGNSVSRIQSAKDIERAYEGLGRERFEVMIRVIQEAFSGQSAIWRSNTIRGMYNLIKSFTGLSLNEDIMIQQLSNLNLDETMEKAKKMNKKNTSNGFCYYAMTEYNKRCRKNSINPKQFIE